MWHIRIIWEVEEKKPMTDLKTRGINWFGEKSSYCDFKNIPWVLKYDQRWTLDGLAGEGFLKNGLFSILLYCSDDNWHVNIFLSLNGCGILRLCGNSEVALMSGKGNSMLTNKVKR